MSTKTPTMTKEPAPVQAVYPLSAMDPADTKMELTCGGAKMVLLYLDKHYGEAAVRTLVAETRMNIDYLLNRSNWMSLSYYYRFLQAVVDFTDDSMSPLKAGRDATRDGCFGPIAPLLARFGSVGGAYRSFVRINHLFTKVASWKLLSVSNRTCRLKLEYPAHKQDRNNCLAIQGVLSSLPELHGCPRARVDHSVCACDEGEDACIYDVTWENPPSFRDRAIGAALGGVAGSLFCLVAGWTGYPLGFSCLLVALGFFIGRNRDSLKRLQQSNRISENQETFLEKSMKETEELNEDLQQQVEERTKALKKANADLRESQKKELAQHRAATIGTLASGMAHELNTPLNTIRLGAQGLLRDPSQTGDDAELVATILRAAKRCSRIVNELLIFSREPQTVSAMRLHQVVEGSLAVFDDEKPDGIRVVREIEEPPPMAQVDGAQTQQVLLNLLINAADAMEQEGQITVRLREEDDYAVVDIEDQGPGIPEDRQRKIFEPFESTKRTTGKGLGLGLSIAAELVEKNKGKIGVINSKAGHGACFTVRFPVASSEQLEQNALITTDPVQPEPSATALLRTPESADAQKTASSRPEFSDEAINLLLAEDDSDAGQILKRMLERHDIRVTHVTSGKQCIAKFNPEKFNAVVTDVLLSDMTGIEVLRAIREEDESFPVIVITGHDSIASAIKALRLGAQDYIRKPLENIQDIVKPVRKAIAHYDLQSLSKRLNADLAVSELRFRSLSKLLPETVFEADREGRVIFLNTAGKSRFGITDEMLRDGFYLPQGVVSDDAGKVESTVMRVLNGETMSGVEFAGLSQSGEVFPILTFATPIRSEEEGITGVRAIVVDISKQKEFESELLYYQDMLRRMDAQLQVTAEKERGKLASDLHDSIAQLLAAAKMHIGLCFRGLKEDGPSENLETASNILADALQQTRSLVFELSPPSLYSQGLQAGLEDLAGHMLPLHRLHVTFNRCEDPVVLDEAASVHVFRAVRELLINVSKHAGVDACVVTVSQQEDKAFVTVEDQGCGFHPSEDTHKRDGGGFGIFSIRERLKTLNGNLDIQSEPGKGTTAVVSVSLQESDE